MITNYILTDNDIPSILIRGNQTSVVTIYN